MTTTWRRSRGSAGPSGPTALTVRASYASRPPLDVLEPEALDAYVRWGFVDRPDGHDRARVHARRTRRPCSRWPPHEHSAPRPRGGTSADLSCAATVALRRRRRTSPGPGSRRRRERAGCALRRRRAAATSSSRRTATAPRRLVREHLRDDRATRTSSGSSRYEEIRQLVARYAVAVDSRDLDALVALFVDDVQVGSRAARSCGAQGVLRPLAARRRDHDPQRRDALIDFDDDDHATRRRVLPRRDPGRRHAGSCRRSSTATRYERRDGHWYFVRRQHLLWYGREVGTSPIGLPPANWPEHHTGTGELPDAWPSWRAFWEVGGAPG